MKEEFDIHKAGNTMPETEREYENALRPLSFESFSGQPKTVKNLKISVAATHMHQEALNHVLLHGPPELGKTTNINLGCEMKNNFWLCVGNELFQVRVE